jgi:hypothetical protein
MRISERKTTAAVLRYVLGQKLDDDFCVLVGCSRDLWRKLENGDRRMTERTAGYVEAAVGISRHWLLAGKPKAQPVAVDGTAFSLEWFRSYRVTQLVGDTKPLPFAVYPAGHLVSLIGAAVAAARAGRLASFTVDLEAAVAVLRSNYGFDAQGAAAALEAMQKDPRPYLLEVTDNAKESAAERQKRLEFLLVCVAGGTAPTSAVIRPSKGGETKLTITGAAHPTKPLRMEPRSSRKKAKP